MCKTNSMCPYRENLLRWEKVGGQCTVRQTSCLKAYVIIILQTEIEDLVIPQNARAECDLDELLEMPSLLPERLLVDRAHLSFTTLIGCK